MVAIGMGSERFDFADNDAVDFRAEVGKLFYFKTAGKELFR